MRPPSTRAKPLIHTKTGSSASKDVSPTRSTSALTPTAEKQKGSVPKVARASPRASQGKKALLPGKKSALNSDIQDTLEQVVTAASSVSRTVRNQVEANPRLKACVTIQRAWRKLQTRRLTRLADEAINMSKQLQA